jgi:membrane protein DedA with SNARE-associated domain
MRRRFLAVVVTVIVCVLIVSSTIGREIFAGHKPGLTSFGIVHFAGYLFFLLMPVEALVPYYLTEGHAGGVLIGLALVTALAAQAIDYGIGRLLADTVIDKVVGRKRFERYLGKIDRWGSWAIFVFNLFPLSSPNMMLVAGMTKFSPTRAFTYSFAGLLLKYVGIVYVFDATGWFTDTMP